MADEPTRTPNPDAPGADGADDAPDPSSGPSLQGKLLIAAVVVAALVALFWPQSDTVEAPGGTLIDAAGRPVPIGSRMAPVTLVHFWATWCPPCMTEIPSLNRLADHMGEYMGDFSILMISVADDQQRVEEFAAERAPSVLYDPDWDVAHQYGTRQLPETYLVVDGEVVEHWEGAQDWDDPDLRARVLEAVEGLGSEGPETARREETGKPKPRAIAASG